MKPLFVTQRRALRRREVRAMYGASFYQIDQAIERGQMRAKRVGKCVFIDPKDAETVFGFEETIEPSRESMAELADFLR